MVTHFIVLTNLTFFFKKKMYIFNRLWQVFELNVMVSKAEIELKRKNNIKLFSINERNLKKLT